MRIEEIDDNRAMAAARTDDDHTALSGRPRWRRAAIGVVALAWLAAACAAPSRGAATAATATATSSVPYARGPWIAVPGAVDKVSADGRRLRVVRAPSGASSGSPIGAIAVFDLAAATSTPSTPLAPNAFKASFDARVQLVTGAHGAEIFDAATGKRTPLAGEPESADVSEDGRYVASSAGVFDRQGATIVCNPDFTFAGGSDPALSFDRGSRLVTVRNSRETKLFDLTQCDAKGAITGLVGVGAAFAVDAAMTVVVDLPHQPFARDYIAAFSVRAPPTTADPRPLPLEIPAVDGAGTPRPYAAAVAPNGRALHVLHAGRLTTFRLPDGAVIHAESATDLGDAAIVALRLFAATDGTLVVVRNEEVSTLKVTP